jgi:hypothetical protein
MKLVQLACRPSILDFDGLAIEPAELAQPSLERLVSL